MRKKIAVERKIDKARRRKDQLEILIALFRKAAALRNEMLEVGFTDNGGTINSASEF